MGLKWTVEFEVDDIWVADGFNPSEEDMQELLLEGWLRHATHNEVKAKIVKKPSDKKIIKLAGCL